MTIRAKSVISTLALVAGLAAPAATAPFVPQHGDRGRDRGRADDALVAAFDQVTRDTVWTQTAALDLDFDVFHPQSMEVVGDRIYLSSVEVIEAPVRFPEPVDGYDRSPGRGVGHLFVLDRAGNLLRDIEITDGDRYHPGGLDVHGDELYLPVAEYRPNSSANLYRVDLDTFRVTRLFQVDDHIGGVVLDEKTGHLVGQSWGSRRFYDWTLTGRQKDFWLNPDHYIDYQDCEYVVFRKMLCSGIAGSLGGFVMIDLRDNHRIRHQVPTQAQSASGRLLTQNPTDIDARRTASGFHLTLYAAPDDGVATQLLVFEADVPAGR